jgi:uncharacterized membrane-anchored protein
MKNFFSLLAFMLALTTPFFTQAQEEPDNARIKFFVDSINNSFQWQTGTIALGDGMATLNVPAGLRYLNPDQSNFVLTNLWGNPPQEKGLGMLFPDNCSPLDAECFAFDIKFDAMGYVKDGDADDIDYNELLTNMKKEAIEANPERVKAGYSPVEIVGWAAAPYYDKTKKVLHWAKEIKFGEVSESNTLNYDVRVLGRKGVLSINAISTVNQLEAVKARIPGLLEGVVFNDGHRYEQFDSKLDDVAAWSIGGLVAGKVLAKAGFFAIILKFIKPILLVVLGGGAAIWRFITGRRKEEEAEAAYENTADTTDTTGTTNS